MVETVTAKNDAQQTRQSTSKSPSNTSIMIGAGFVATLGLSALVAGAAWSSSAAARDQSRTTMEEEEDEIAQLARNAQARVPPPPNSQVLNEIEGKVDVRLLADGRRLAMRALGLGSLLAVGIVGSLSMLVWVGFGLPRTFRQFRDRAGETLPKLTKENNEKLDFNNLRELSDFLERQK